ncbi:hypothetical protein HY993_04190 [Candidatus Micrarchaeota archaeon]|nr:hypothetical protein [Candidatus Micrarchaeota archaeon]
MHLVGVYSVPLNLISGLLLVLFSLLGPLGFALFYLLSLPIGVYGLYLLYRACRASSDSSAEKTVFSMIVGLFFGFIFAVIALLSFFFVLASVPKSVF